MPDGQHGSVAFAQADAFRCRAVDSMDSPEWYMEYRHCERDDVTDASGYRL
jgi:hypothetical protein